MKAERLHSPMIEEILEHLTDDTKVYVGCDSAVYQGEARYIVILYRKDFCKIFKRTHKLPDYGSIQTRLLQEAAYETALVVRRH